MPTDEQRFQAGLQNFLEKVGRDMAWYNSLSPGQKQIVRDYILAGVVTKGPSTPQEVIKVVDTLGEEKSKKRRSSSAPVAKTTEPAPAKPSSTTPGSAPPSRADALEGTEISYLNPFLQDRIEQAHADTFVEAVSPDKTLSKSGQEAAQEYDQYDRHLSRLARGRDPIVETTRQIGPYMEAFARLPSEQIEDMQKRLEAAGYLKTGEYVLGQPDDATQDALFGAIQDSRQQDKPLMGHLKDRAVQYKASKLKADALTVTEMAEQQYKQQLAAKYVELWGVAPPPGYLDRALASGMNLFEFEYNERQKPSFANSPRYHMERIETEFQLANEFGALGGAGVAGSF